MVDPRLLEQIDACRPASRDCELPENSELARLLVQPAADASSAADAEAPCAADAAEARAVYQQVQRLDARLTTAFQQVPVPAGLAEQILGALAAAAPADWSRSVPLAAEDSAVLADAEHAPVPSMQLPSSALPGVEYPATRRRWLRFALAGSAALVVGALAAVFGLRSDHRPLEITAEAAGWYAQLRDDWQPMADAPKKFAPPAALAVAPRGWQRVSQAQGKGSVAYDLKVGPRVRAVLFVLSAKRPNLPGTMPGSPQSTTAGLAIGAWQSGSLVYVLVVRGDEGTYRRLVSPPHPLT